MNIDSDPTKANAMIGKEILWYYNTVFYLPQILLGKEIELGYQHIGPKKRQTVWFSENPRLEEARWLIAGKPASIYRVITEFGTLFRIGVAPETAPYWWDEYKRLIPDPVQVVERRADMPGSPPSEWPGWWASFEAVPYNKWISIELWDWKDRQWTPAEDSKGDDLEHELIIGMIHMGESDAKKMKSKISETLSVLLPSREPKLDLLEDEARIKLHAELFKRAQEDEALGVEYI